MGSATPARAGPRPACMSAAPTAPEDVAEMVAAVGRAGVRQPHAGGGAVLAAVDRREGVREMSAAATTAPWTGATVAATPAARRRRPAGRHRPRRRPPMTSARVGDRDAEFLPVGRDGRRGDDRARPRAGAAGPARAGDDRRRRDADGHGLARQRSPRPARRNLAIAVLDNARFGETGVAAQPYRPDHRPRGGGRRLRLAATATARDMAEVEALRPAAARRGAVRGDPDLRRGEAALYSAARRRLSGRAGSAARSASPRLNVPDARSAIRFRHQHLRDWRHGPFRGQCEIRRDERTVMRRPWRARRGCTGCKVASGVT